MCNGTTCGYQQHVDMQNNAHLPMNVHFLESLRGECCLIQVCMHACDVYTAWETHSANLVNVCVCFCMCRAFLSMCMRGTDVAHSSNLINVCVSFVCVQVVLWVCSCRTLRFAHSDCLGACPSRKIPWSWHQTGQGAFRWQTLGPLVRICMSVCVCVCLRVCLCVCVYICIRTDW